MILFSTIISILVLGYIFINILFYIVGKNNLSYSPISSIWGGIGVMATINTLIAILYPFNLFPFNFNNLLFIQLTTLAISIFMGGFVSTFFSRDNKVKFAIYLGVIVLVIILITGALWGFANINIALEFIGAISITILLSATIGGVIAKKCKKFIIKKQTSMSPAEFSL